MNIKKYKEVLEGKISDSLDILVEGITTHKITLVKAIEVLSVVGLCYLVYIVLNNTILKTNKRSWE